MVENNEIFDVIIIGGGCAGYPAGMYAGRYNLKTLVITNLRGGLITTTHLVENWPGEISLSGPELGQRLEKHMLENNANILDANVSTISKNKDDMFEIKTESQTLLSKTLILATGAKHRHLGIPSEKEFIGKGVSYCATCDGGFYRKKDVCIIGGGDSSLKEAMVLASLCNKVYLIVRGDKLKGEPINVERVKNLENVELIFNEEVETIKGNEFVESIFLKNKKQDLNVEGVFVSVGLLPSNELALSMNVEVNSRGEIIIDKDSKTNVSGLFSAGDVTNSGWKQGIVAASEGAIAANSAFEYISKKFK